MDEVSFYNRALTTNDIRMSMYRPDLMTNGRIGYYDFGDGVVDGDDADMFQAMNGGMKWEDISWMDINGNQRIDANDKQNVETLVGMYDYVYGDDAVNLGDLLYFDEIWLHLLSVLQYNKKVLQMAVQFNIWLLTSTLVM